jgi:hypothetical protein
MPSFGLVVKESENPQLLFIAPEYSETYGHKSNNCQNGPGLNTNSICQKKEEESAIKARCNTKHREIPEGSTALRIQEQYSRNIDILEYSLTDVKIKSAKHEKSNALPYFRYSNLLLNESIFLDTIYVYLPPNNS